MDRSHHGEKLYMQAFREIRKYMIEQDLQPGDLLPTEQQLCQMLGVSRNVLREAIKSMEVMGLIEACPGRGTEVREFRLDFVLQNVIFFANRDLARRAEELAGIQKTIELSYMRQAFRAITTEQVAELRATVKKLRTLDPADIMAVYLQHKAFHEILFRSLDNQVLRDLLKAVDALQRECVETEQGPPVPEPERMEAVVGALEEYNFQTFAQAMEAYFSRGVFANQDILDYGK